MQNDVSPINGSADVKKLIILGDSHRRKKDVQNS